MKRNSLLGLLGPSDSPVLCAGGTGGQNALFAKDSSVLLHGIGQTMPGLRRNPTATSQRSCQHSAGGRKLRRIPFQRSLCAGASSDVFSANDDYHKLCIATSQALVNILPQPVPEPENIKLVDLMQDVGDTLVSKSRSARAGFWCKQERVWGTTTPSSACHTAYSMKRIG